MKALSVQLPWAWLFFLKQNPKDCENRSWKLPDKMIGERIAIHCAKTIDYDGWFHLEGFPANYGLDTNDEFMNVFYVTPQKIEALRGTLIGEVTIQVCRFRFGEENDNLYSKWSVPGQYGFYVDSPVLYDKPIPYRGQLGFFEVELTDE